MATTDLSPTAPVISQRFKSALSLALDLHRLQLRKGTNIPYASHLLAVTALVLEHGGTEDQAIAAALHDAVEDQGGQTTLDRIWAEFGPHVARLVEALSDADHTPKPEWRARKERFIARVASMPEEALLVALACRAHNARIILSELRTHDTAAWDRLKGGRDGTKWFYRALVTEMRKRTKGALLEEMERMVREMEGS